MANAGVNASEAAMGGEEADDVLLERFAVQREQAAFAALVQRHGPMVLGVCRRILQHEQDAEDAFQAVFCVLACKANRIRRRTAVGGWLYGVASRIARKAKTLQVRHRMRANPLPDVPAPDKQPELEWRELWPILDEELNRLPERYRQPFVLCHLEGKTTQEAAAELHCPPGTVSSRLTRARERLRARLTRRGFALSVGTLAAAVGRQTATAAVPAALAQTAVQISLGYSSGLPVAKRAADLADSFLKWQALIRWVKAAGLFVVAGLVIVTLLLLTRGRNVQTDPELQGTWKAARASFGGQEGPAVNLEMSFAGDRFTMRSDIFPPMSATVRVDPNKDPKEIDLFYPNTGVTERGIYRVVGDRLQLCINPNGGDRPANLSPGKFNYFELQRTTAAPR